MPVLLPEGDHLRPGGVGQTLRPGAPVGAVHLGHDVRVGTMAEFRLALEAVITGSHATGTLIALFRAT